MTSVRVLTPTGRGAIAVVEVAGPEAVERVDCWFAAANGRPLSEQPIGALRFGEWRRRRDGAPDPQSAGEEIVVVRTAIDRIEVHCHGGVAAPAAVRGCLESDGVATRSSEPTSLIQDARRALSQATTERVAGVLLDQVNGALDDAIRSIVADLGAGENDAANVKLQALLSRERLGRRLTIPWRVVLAGPPNVGKSSLINALVGYDRAIVYDQPGTTRDVVTASTAIDGWPVTLADTAGLRVTEDPLEAAGVALARKTLATADVLVLVRDATDPAAPDWPALVGTDHHAAVIDVANQVDRLPTGSSLPTGALPTVAPTGEGVPELLAAIAAAFGIESLPAGAAEPFRDWHFDTLRAALDGGPSERRARLLAMLASREGVTVE